MSKDTEEDDGNPEALEEAGILEADVGANFDQQLSGIDPRLKINMDPQAHRDLRPEMMFIREELRQAKWQTLAVRRAALKKLLMKDFLEEDCELKNIGLSYAPPDPYVFNFNKAEGDFDSVMEYLMKHSKSFEKLQDLINKASD